MTLRMEAMKKVSVKRNLSKSFDAVADKPGLLN